MEKLKQEQLKLAKKLVLKDMFDDIAVIAGCDVCYTGKKMITVISVLDYEGLKLKESKYTITEPSFPYMPEFLSYREASAIISCYHELENDFDMIVLSGTGIHHPRGFGLASFIGLALDKPSIGVSKKLLWGELKDSTVYLKGKPVAKEIKTKDKAKPIYVSPGHKISLLSAVDVVKHCLKEHKLPEPMHEAHKLAAKLKRAIKRKKSNQ